MPLFDTAVIIGPGLIGGSLGMALRERGLAGRVVGVGRRQTSLDRALSVGAVDEVSLDAAEAVRRADLVVLATSVGLVVRQANELLPLMQSRAVLTDVGSVKGAICDAVADGFQRKSKGACFVGGHPLAGSEQRGVDAATGDLFDNAICILTPDERTDANGKGLRAVRCMWEAAGSRVLEMTTERHDRLLAEISHMPHVLASCLVEAVSEEALDVAGRGFLDTTRIASGDAGLWLDICLANKDALLGALDALVKRLDTFRDALNRGDAEAIRLLLAHAKERRDARLDGQA
jgi:prephenate dehydrogenase